MSSVQLLTLCSLCLQCYLLKYGNPAFYSQIKNLEIISFFPPRNHKNYLGRIKARGGVFVLPNSFCPKVKPVFWQFWCLYIQCFCELSTRNQQKDTAVYQSAEQSHGLQGKRVYIYCSEIGTKYNREKKVSWKKWE